ncbi:hypothetical protein MMC16_000980 [Acarospora aff. strigata]|nr:hypothetical protein [Acarospora aff. strigata]
MPSVRYFNQTAPFWDFVANLESNADHPFFSAYNTASREGQNAGTPPPAAQQGDTASPFGQHPPPPPPPEAPHSDAPQHAFLPSPFGRHGGPGCGFGHHRGGPRRGGFGGHRGRGGFPFGGAQPFDLNSIAQFFQQQFGVDPDATGEEKEAKDGGKDFTPSADVFDTEDGYVIHVALPGAKKEDVGLNWDADKSELSIAGVVYRPGDEDFLKTLAMAERKVGVFERKIRLGSRASPAQVDTDSISAKMEDGVLIVTIPKLDREYVEIKKVDIE